MMQIEICTRCKREIGLDEQAYVFKDQIVCEECDVQLRNAKLPRAAEHGPPTSMQLAFARQLDIAVPETATRHEVAVMIDEELAYRKLVSVENDGAAASRWSLKPRRVAIAMSIGLALVLLSLLKYL